MTVPHDDQRDPQLSALLQANVDAPALRPGFHDELEARLRSGDSAITRIPARRKRLATRRLIAAASVAAAAAVFVFAVLPALRGGDTATAGDVLAAMTAASGGAQTVRMHLVSTAAVTGTDADAPEWCSTEEEDLTLSIAGDSLSLMKTTNTSMGDDGVSRSTSFSHTTGYDARLHEARSFLTGEALRKGMTIRRPAWQTDLTALGGDDERYPSLTANLRAAVAAANPSLPVEETTYLGRPAWHGVFTVRQQWGMDGELAMVFRWDATVDQATGLLVAASCRVEAAGQPVAWDSATARASARRRRLRSFRGRPCLLSLSGRRRATGSPMSPVPAQAPVPCPSRGRATASWSSA
jgi:hypothetical protein